MAGGWDLVFRFPKGAGAGRGEIVCTGPQVAVGLAPGPGGLEVLDPVALNNRHALVTAHAADKVTIEAMGLGEVRVAPKDHLHWTRIPPIRGRMRLNPGDEILLGDALRGALVIFVEVRPQAEAPTTAPAGSFGKGAALPKLKGFKVRRPRWGLRGVVLGILAVLVLGLAGTRLLLDDEGVALQCPVTDGVEVYRRADLEPTSVGVCVTEAALRSAIRAFVMAPNARAAKWAELETDSGLWDDRFIAWVGRSVVLHAGSNRFWARLDAVEPDYRYVLGRVQDAGLPDVVAAIPYQGSVYDPTYVSPLCEAGWWQLLPEVAVRGGVVVRDCVLRGTRERYTPKGSAPVRNLLSGAPYVRSSGDEVTCRLGRCATDQRGDRVVATTGALAVLAEAWSDPTIAASGAAVQLTLLSHVAGLDSARHPGGQASLLNVLPAYARHLDRRGVPRDPMFYGANLRCIGPDHGSVRSFNQTCGGLLGNRAQHFAYSVVAQHILAACYYGSVHGDRGFWADYRRRYGGAEGFCAQIITPEGPPLW